MRKLLVLLLIAVIAVVAVPQIAVARDHGGISVAHDHGQGHSHGNSDDNGNQEVNASFRVRLEGNQQSPQVNTTGFGFARITLIDNTTLRFSLTVCDIANVTLAHIHVGASGTNGPPVVPFFDETKYPFSVTHGCALLAAGIRTPSDLILRPEAGINNWNDFVHALLTNNTYVNVHTAANPLGEIRGQLILRHPIDHDRDQGHEIEQGDAENNDD
jgi:hypothetical protein